MESNVNLSREAQKKKRIYQGQYKTVFSRMKQFCVLGTYFHHSDSDNGVVMWKYHLCLEAVLTIPSLKFMIGGDSLFDGGTFNVDYVV